MSLPLVVSVRPAPDVGEALARFAALPHVALFDSALRSDGLGRYSSLMADPFETFRSSLGDRETWDRLAAKLAEHQEASEGPTPFTGGLAGVFGYELGHELERLPRAAWDEFALPTLCAGLYDVALCFDHKTDQAWLVSHGFPERTHQNRLRRAQQRIEQFQAILDAPVPAPMAMANATKSLAEEALAPRFENPRAPGVWSDFSQVGYLAAVQRVIDYIHAGDVFQVNLSQRLLTPAPADPVALYRKLRARSPAPFGGYFDLGEAQVLSASPERFLSARDGWLETRPIKGTRPRAIDPDADTALAASLAGDAKERAENTMIVDLLRNDLSRVATPDSVRVTQHCKIESYEQVHHLVSAIEARLAPGRTALEALRCAFPGGSITGAPKVRAMEIIAELEPTARGFYCGAMVQAGFNGSLDSSILIRTITRAAGWLQMPVGGGVVADSEPEREYEETWHKAAGLLRAISARPEDA